MKAPTKKELYDEISKLKSKPLEFSKEDLFNILDSLKEIEEDYPDMKISYIEIRENPYNFAISGITSYAFTALGIEKDGKRVLIPFEPPITIR